MTDDPAPLVSVVVPTRDRAALLGETLASVRAQTLADWECIVVDDGSTDGTDELVRRLAERDPRVRYVRREIPRNAAAARNQGASLARGRYLGFLDSDDLFEPDKLAWQCAALEARPDAVLVYGETFQFQDGDPSRGGLYLGHVPWRPCGDAREGLLVRSAIYAPLVRTEAFRRAGGFDETLVSAEDWDMWLTLAREGAVLHEPRVALRYRLHPGNKSADLATNLACARRVAAKHLALLPRARRRRVARAVARTFRESYGPRLEQAAWEASKQGDWPRAQRAWRALARLAPRRLRSRSALAHALWAALPGATAPPWWPGAGEGRGQRLLRRALVAPPRLALDLARPGLRRHRALAQLAAARTRLAWTMRGRRLRRAGRRVVAIALVEHLGDVVAAEPIARELRRRQPDAWIVWLVRRPYRELVAAFEAVDEVLVVRCLTQWILLAEDPPFDEVVDLHVHGRSCDVCSWELARREQRGVHLRNYYDHGPLLEVFCRAAGLQPPADPGPRLLPPPAAADAVDELALPDAFVAVHAASLQVERDWRPKRWDELARRIADELGLPVVEVGLRRVLDGRSRGYRDLCGRLSPLGTAEVLRRARLFVGVDSGPAHLASAVGVPGVVLLGRYRSYARYTPFAGGYGDGSLATLVRAADGPAADVAVEEAFAAVAARLLGRAGGVPAHRPGPSGTTRIGVVVPSYGHASYVGEAVASVLAQGWPALDVVVVDDGSPDDVAAALAPWVADGRVRLVRQPNGGQAAARARGLREVRGELVAFLDDDDLWPPGTLAARVAELERHPEAVLAWGPHATLLPDGRRVPPPDEERPQGWCRAAFQRRNWIHSPGQTLIRRDALERAGGFDAALAGSDDWDLYLRLAREGTFRVLPEVALVHRVHGANASRHAIEHARRHVAVMRRHLPRSGRARRRHLRLAGEYFTPNLQREAAEARSAGDHARTVRALGWALRFRPGLLLRPRFAATLVLALLRVPSLGRGEARGRRTARPA